MPENIHDEMRLNLLMQHIRWLICSISMMPTFILSTLSCPFIYVRCFLALGL
ncbi:hypothetical protein JHK82_046922 [Glycine max]|nr:hypothetical protein JHK86_046813 [Glycine max]KAG4932607.1 hypothetical protein JHK87_046609 [Glycine soja]KAG5097068.1 hypothetical protein JHK82_046922 [Glycine max]